jgi:Transposase DDE domain
MSMIPKVVAELAALLGSEADAAAKACGVIRRVRKFTGSLLLQTLVFGFLAHPNASDEDLAETAESLGIDVSPQAVAQRFDEKLPAFLEAVFRKAIRVAIGSSKSLAPMLDRFTSVVLMDSTTISLPPELHDRFPGCGGSYGGGKAALKLQVQLDLRRGALNAISIESGRNCDYKTPLQLKPLPKGSLRITDLGYFELAVFEETEKAGNYWLSRLQFGTSVFTPEGVSLGLMSWLSTQPGPFVDTRVLLGSGRKLACRLVAWRLPKEAANRRRQKLIAETLRKDGRTPSKERLEWCDWTILVTNVPEDMLAPKDLTILYRARWQIELLFKRWKSLGLVAELTGSTTPRQMARLWVRLTAVLVQHWLLVTTAWGDARYSLVKVCRIIRKYANRMAEALSDPAQLEAVIERICTAIRARAKQNKRKKPSTFQLLNEPELLEYDL